MDLVWIFFYYGLLHALAPDHLAVISSFSIGKSTKKTFSIVVLFALGHGTMLYIFSNILHSFLSEDILVYGDYIASSVIIIMGIFLIYKAFSGKIILNMHEHNGKKHLHISTNKTHTHKEKLITFTLASLMGIGGSSGMLSTLALASSQKVDVFAILSFISGVSFMFLLFGFLIFKINTSLIKSKNRIKTIFLLTGLFSIFAGFSILAG